MRVMPDANYTSLKQTCHDDQQSITELFRQAGTDPAVAAELFQLIRERFRRLGASKKRKFGAGGSLTTDAMVNQTFYNLLKKHPGHWRNREHILRTAGVAMQNIVIDHLRRNRHSGLAKMRPRNNRLPVAKWTIGRTSTRSEPRSIRR